ncbi:MAG: endolytic transglycosylase MltG [Oscillospiraceae bacterium]|nr:endolytic transglycosylase MltG [Oscillospiraceae bacterium]
MDMNNKKPIRKPPKPKFESDVTARLDKSETKAKNASSNTGVFEHERNSDLSSTIPGFPKPTASEYSNLDSGSNAPFFASENAMGDNFSNAPSINDATRQLDVVIDAHSFSKERSPFSQTSSDSSSHSQTANHRKHFEDFATRQLNSMSDSADINNADTLPQMILPETNANYSVDSGVKEPPKLKAMSEKKKAALKKRIKRRKEHVRTFSHIFGSVLLVAFIITVSAFLAQFIVRAFLDFTGINVVEFTATITIPTDATTEEIAEILGDYEIISMPSLFIHYARLSDNDGGFLDGLFRFSSTMSYNQIISTLQNRPQSTETVMVTIPEGLTAREIGELLEYHLVCRAEDFMYFYRNRMNRFDFELRLEDNSLKLNQMEGFLFPETYEFFVVNGLYENPDMDTTIYAEVVARTLFFQFNSQMTREIYRGIADLGDTFPGFEQGDFGLNEFVTLASMVQWEAASPEDMRRVASVFINRLRNPDSFQTLDSDVTERYARLNIEPYLNNDNRVLLESMIESFDTYNTSGLPPGPINNPGMNAMLAVLDAPRTSYFFFCADIETGQKFFAETLTEHEANLRLAGLVDEYGNLIHRD